MMGDPVKMKQVIVRNVQPASSRHHLTGPIFSPRRLGSDPPRRGSVLSGAAGVTLLDNIAGAHAAWDRRMGPHSLAGLPGAISLAEKNGGC